MKIAFIGQKGIPAFSGGVEKHVEVMAAKMAEFGHEVFAYARNNYTDPKLKNYKGVRIIHLPSISSKHLDAISHTFLATIHALFQDYDVIHYQAIGPSSLSWIIKLFRPKIALVSTFHCQDYYHQKWNWLAKMYLKLSEKIACQIPDRTIAVSNILAKLVKEKYGREAEIIPNGAAVRYSSEKEVLEKFGLKEKRYILSVGRLIKHKGVHYLIEAFKQLEDTTRVPNNFKLVIVGEGFHTDDYVKYLKFLSRNRPNIIFTGALYGRELDQIFSHAFIFIQPSESEGMSIALLESMGHGTPALVSDIPENREVVDNCGFYFRPGDIADIKSKLAYFINQPDLTSDIGCQGKDRILKYYGWDASVKKTLKVYEQLIQKKSGYQYGAKKT